MDNINEEKRNITIKEAARLMKKHEAFVRIGIQRGLFKFGVAEKLPGKTKYSYHISPKLFYEYLGIADTSSLQNESDIIKCKRYTP